MLRTNQEEPQQFIEDTGDLNFTPKGDKKIDVLKSPEYNLKSKAEGQNSNSPIASAINWTSKLINHLVTPKQEEKEEMIHESPHNAEFYSPPTSPNDRTVDANALINPLRLSSIAEFDPLIAKDDLFHFQSPIAKNNTEEQLKTPPPSLLDISNEFTSDPLKIPKYSENDLQERLAEMKSKVNHYSKVKIA
jgi:hypothetical protein